MSMNVSPRVVIISDCTSCCPRVFRWLCCCMTKAEADDHDQAVYRAAVRAVENQRAQRALAEDPDSVVQPKRVKKKKIRDKIDKIRSESLE